MSWEIRRKKGEVLHGILNHISTYEEGARWSEIRNYMVQSGYAGKNNQVTMTLSRPLDSKNAVCNERGFCNKNNGRWLLNCRGKAKLDELRQRFNPKVVTPKTAPIPKVATPKAATVTETPKIDTVVDTIIDINRKAIESAMPVKVERTDKKITITIEIALS